MSEAEAFVTTIKNESKLSEEDTVQRARQHSLDTVDVVAGKEITRAVLPARGWGGGA